MSKKNKHQFIHLETYSRVPPKHTKQWSAYDALKEAWRIPKHSGHIREALKPKLLHGMEAKEIADYLHSLEQIKTDTGRKLRKDAKVLLAGVASYPKPLVQISKDDVVALHAWETATRNFLYRKFGTRLVSIIRHTDETYPHLHFYILPRFAEGEKMDDIHPGMKRRRDCKGGKHAKQSAMVAGLVEFQDEYYQQVSQHFGHSRISRNPKARQKYAFWQRYKAMNKTIHKLTIKNEGTYTMDRFYNTREDHKNERAGDIKRIIDITQQGIIDGSIELYELALMTHYSPNDTALAFQFMDVHETAINTVRKTGLKGKRGLEQFKRYIGAPLTHLRGIRKRREINRRFNQIAKARYFAIEATRGKS